MTTTRKQHSPQFKARVVIEAIRGHKTLSQLASQFKVHPIQIAKWRKAALEQMPELFVDGRTRKARTGETDNNALYEEIGRLKVELDCHDLSSAGHKPYRHRGRAPRRCRDGRNGNIGCQNRLSSKQEQNE